MQGKVIKELIYSLEERPTPQCHASTLVKMDNGEIVAAWFGGTKESSNDVDIWVSIRGENGWSKPVAISSDPNIAHWNPVLFKRNDGTICLYFKVGTDVPDWYTHVAYSTDNARTWTTSVELVPGDIGGRGPVKNKILKLSDGRWVAPASLETGNKQIGRNWWCFADISFDEGETWQKQEDIRVPLQEEDPILMIQPTLWESAPGKVHMLTRTNQGYAFRSDSEDYGETWCEAYKTVLFNNNSGLDVVKLEDGTLVLISNPVTENWGDRTPLTLMYSKDNGVSWTEFVKLETEEGEYSYPSIIADGNTLYMTYTYKRDTVAFCEVTLSE